jgi:hypothetical protein
MCRFAFDLSASAGHVSERCGRDLGRATAAAEADAKTRAATPVQILRLFFCNDFRPILNFVSYILDIQNLE